MIMPKKKKILISFSRIIIYAVMCYVICSVTYSYSEMTPSSMYFVRFVLGMVRLLWICALPVFMSIIYSKWVHTPKRGQWDENPNNNLFKCYIFITPCNNPMLKIAISRQYVYNALKEKMQSKITFNDIKNTIRGSLEPFLYEKTHRNPIVIPVILNSKEAMAQMQQMRQQRNQQRNKKEV